MSSAFDDQVAAYDRWYATPLGQLVDRLEKEALYSLLPEVRGQRLLEVGCGTGNISLALAHQGAWVVGVDASGPMLAAARHKAADHVIALTLVRGLAGRLPFRDASFDGVLGILALDFISDREGALQEMVRVLRPGGFLVVAVLNRFSLWTLKRLVRSWFTPSLWRQVRFLTPRALKDLLASHRDLTKGRLEQAIFFPPWANHRAQRCYPTLENLGKKLHLRTGAFLVATARKKRDSLPPGGQPFV
jgi:ubiquinone/menaquinone biosynthesis C-methylase UbiE